MEKNKNRWGKKIQRNRNLSKVIIMDRKTKIIKTSFLGIIVNIFLVIFKSIIGYASHSIAIISDAINNFTDVLSSVITIIGTKLASKEPDKEHPYGHGRIEYFTALILSAIILYAGASAIKESVEKIFNPEGANYSLVPLVIIFIAVIAKIFLGRYYKKVGNSVNSHTLVASGEDAIMDSVLSSATLVSALINYFFHLELEGYLGVIIGIFIIKTGIEVLKSAISLILGERVDSELAKKLKDKINSFEEVQGTYDLNLHYYGPAKIVGSAHIQVRNDMTAEDIHILTRKIEYVVYDEYSIAMTLGIYAANDSGEYGKIKQELEDILKTYSDVLQLHGFYVDKEKNVYFDLIIDFKVENKQHLKDEIVEKIKEKYPDYNYNVIIDSDITD